MLFQVQMSIFLISYEVIKNNKHFFMIVTESVGVSFNNKRYLLENDIDIVLIDKIC